MVKFTAATGIYSFAHTLEGSYDISRKVGMLLYSSKIVIYGLRSDLTKTSHHITKLNERTYGF